MFLVLYYPDYPHRWIPIKRWDAKVPVFKRSGKPLRWPEEVLDQEWARPTYSNLQPESGDLTQAEVGGDRTRFPG